MALYLARRNSHGMNSRREPLLMPPFPEPTILITGHGKIGAHVVSRGNPHG